MDNKTRQMVEGGFRRGILKTNVGNIERILSRTVDNAGRVVTGEAGRQLLRRKLEAKAYYDRNR